MRFVLPVALMLAASVVVAFSWDASTADSCPPVEVRPVSASTLQT
jgi:hypothetical protein